jgi:hypothetical protein
MILITTAVPVSSIQAVCHQLVFVLAPAQVPGHENSVLKKRLLYSIGHKECLV